MKKLQQWGVTLLILGIGSYVLPLLGLQFPVFSLLRAIPRIAAILLGALGALLLIIGLVRRPKTASKPMQPQTAPLIADQEPTHPASNSSSCASCGSSLQAEEMFCANCGSPRIQPANEPVQPLPPAQKKSSPKTTHALLNVGLVTLGGVFVIGLCVLAVRSGLLRRKTPAAAPNATAGSLVESPIDTASKNSTKAPSVETPAATGVHPSQPTVSAPVKSTRRTDPLPAVKVDVPGSSTGTVPPGIATASRGNPATPSLPADPLSQITVSVAPPPSQPPGTPSRAASNSPRGGLPSRESATRAIYNGPQFGTLRWSGVVEEGGVITIDGDRASSGIVNGALPGLPIQVELVSKHAAISEAPAPSNGWKRIAIRSSKRQTSIDLKWTVLP